MCKEYEQTYFFMLLADRWATHHDVERPTGGGAPVMGWAAALRLPLPPSTRLHQSAFHGLIDRFWQRLQPLIYAAREAAVNVLSPRRSADGIKRLWMGNQASEAPTRRHQADFGFLIARGLLDPKENLYFLGGKVSAEASAKLAERTIRWSPENLGASPYLSYGERLAAFLKGAWISVAAFFTKRLHGPGVSSGRAIGAVGDPRAQAAPQVMPDDNQLLLARAPRHGRHGRRGRAHGHLVYQRQQLQVRGELQRLSRFGCRFEHGLVVLIVWNRAVADLYMAPRQVEAARPKPLVAGPLMCGDSRRLSKKPEEARREFGLEGPSMRTVVAFDVLPQTRATRLRIGMGPSPYTPEAIEAFYGDLRAALDRFPDMRLLLKSKRTLATGVLYIPQALRDLTDPTSAYVLQG